MELVTPPKDTPPDRLFRILTRPRPTLPISYRVGGAEAWKLSVRAIPAREWAECLDDAGAIEELQPGRTLAGLVARALLADGQRAFDSIEEVLALSDDEIVPLSAAVLDGLDRTGSIRGRRDESEWWRVLTLGALHPSNSADRFALGISYEVAGPHVLDRPERYYGVAPVELTEGQLLAYRVCRKIVDDASK